MNRIAVVLGTVLFIQIRVFAIGTLQLGPVQLDGNQVTVPIMLGGNSASDVSALNFQLNYNPDLVRPISVEPGFVAISAEKRVLANVTLPGKYTVVVIGMNQTTCRPGQIALARFERMSNTQGPYGLGIAEPTLSSSEGAIIESQVLEPQAVPNEPDAPRVPKTRSGTKRPNEVHDRSAQPAQQQNVEPVVIASSGAQRGAEAETTKSDETSQSMRRELDDVLEQAARARQEVVAISEEDGTATPSEDAEHVEANEDDDDSVPSTLASVKKLNTGHEQVGTEDNVSKPVPPIMPDAHGTTSGSRDNRLLFGVLIAVVVAGIVIVARRVRRP